MTLGFGAGAIAGAPVWAGPVWPVPAGPGTEPVGALGVRPGLAWGQCQGSGEPPGLESDTGGHWLGALCRPAELLVSGLRFAKHSGTPLAANLGDVTVQAEGMQEQKRGF